MLVGCVLAALLAGAGLFATDWGVDPTVWLVGVTVVFLLFLAALDPWLNRRRAVNLSTDENLAAAATALSAALRAQWRAECQARGLDTGALELRWTATELPVTDQPPVPAGRSDAVVGAYERLPHRRLVITGAPGSGKSTLAMLLTIGLLDRYTGGAVPVYLPLSTWDPTAEDLRAWLTRRLCEDHPALRNAELYGNYAADLLVEQRLVFPILDGLDEIPADRRVEALRRLAIAAPLRCPLVLTSRREEFAAAVAQAGPVPGAAVLEIQPLTHEEIAGYLRQHTDPVVAARWEPVFLQMRGEPGGRLTDALATPLALWLASEVYGTGAAEPTELLDRAAFPDRAAVLDHLVDGLVTAAFQDPRVETSQVWPAARARRALTVLADQLTARGSREFAWWELRRSVPPLLLATLGALALGLISAFSVAWLMTYASSPKLAPATGLGAGLVMGARTVFVSTAAYRARSNRPRLGVWRSMLMSSVGIGAVFGLVFGALYGFTTGLVVGFGLTLGSALRYALASSAELTRPSSPKGTMARDRALVWTGSLVLGVLFGTTSAVVFGRYEPGMVGLGLTSGVLLGFAVSVQSLRWWWFTVARAWLALRGRLPWQLMAFLDDAHRLGVLRQSGARYQFRHSILHDRLATRPSPRPAGPRGTRSGPRGSRSSLRGTRSGLRVGRSHLPGGEPESATRT